MAVVSHEAMGNIGQTTREGLSLPAGDIGESLRALRKSMSYKVLEIVTTHPPVSTIVYKLGLIKWSPMSGPACAFPMGDRRRVEGIIK